MTLPFPTEQERGGGDGRGITDLLSVGSPSKDVLPSILGQKEIFPMVRNLTVVRVMRQQLLLARKRSWSYAKLERLVSAAEASVLAFLVRETDATTGGNGEGDRQRERRAERRGGWGGTIVEEGEGEEDGEKLQWRKEVNTSPSGFHTDTQRSSRRLRQSCLHPQGRML